jgi:hypothetical protein
MRSISILLALVIAGCVTPLPVVVVNSVPANHAWWLRTSFNPSGTTLRGIPVSRIDPGWCKITELEAGIFPDTAEVQDSVSGVRAPDAKFSLETTVQGKPITLVLAVFQKCEGGTGTALVALAERARGGKTVLVAQAVSFPAAWATLSRGESGHVELWWCFECDNVDTLEWDPEAGLFVGVEDGES